MATLSASSAPAQGPKANAAWLWHFLVIHRRATIASIVCGVIAGITTAAVPSLIGTTIDHIQAQAKLSDIGGFALLLIGLTVLSVAAFYGQRMLSGYVAVAVNFDVSLVLFENLLTLEQTFYQHYPTGELIARLQSDVDLIWQMLTLTLTRIGSAVFTIITAFVLLGAINLPLTMLVLVILTVSSAIQMQVGRILAPIFETVQAQEGVMTSLIQDAYSGIQTVKAFGREDIMGQRYMQENAEYRRRWLFFQRRNQPVGMVPNTIADTMAALVVLFGGILTINKALTLGDFVEFLVFLALISQSLLQLATIYQRWQQTVGGLVRLTPLLQPAHIADAPDAIPLPTPRGEIMFDDVGIKMNDQWLLRHISLTIPAGTTVALVGPTGGGKTLLVSLLARVIDPTEGRILVDGVDVRKLKLTDLRRAIAYVPQTTFLFSMPLHRNVRMDRDDIGDDVLNRAIYTSRLSNDLPQLPHGVDTLVGERGVMLSGGQKQRVAIARAIVQDPAILVLDDALSSVDTQTAADILGDLRHVLRTRTSIIIAHRIATVKDADLIVVLADGKIAEQGTHASLLAKDGLYAQMVERELHQEAQEKSQEDDNGEQASGYLHSYNN